MTYCTIGRLHLIHGIEMFNWKEKQEMKCFNTFLFMLMSNNQMKNAVNLKAIKYEGAHNFNQDIDIL